MQVRPILDGVADIQIISVFHCPVLISCVFLIVTIYHLHIPASWGSWHHLDFSRLGPESDKTFNIVNNLILLDQQQYIQGKGKDFYLNK